MLEQQTGSKVVLVVDDDLMSRTKIAIAVEKLGYQSIKVPGGEEALEALKSETVHIMLLDLLMPEMDGFEVIETVRQIPEFTELPIVVVSSFEDGDSEARALSLGATRCLRKGFESSTLTTCLEEVLKGDAA